MFRIKLKPTIYVAILITCMFSISGCSSKSANTSTKKVEDMLLLDSINDDSASSNEVIQTAEVIIGNIPETLANNGSISYPISSEVSHDCKYGTVSLKEYIIKELRQIPVSKGDIIAVLEVQIEPIAREEARIKYEKALLTHKNQLEDLNNDLEDLREDIANEENSFKKQSLELTYEELLEEYDIFVAEQEEYLAELYKTYEMYCNEKNELIITAPYDGLIRIAGGNPGDIIEPGQSLATIYSSEKIQFRITSSTKFNFGSDASILISEYTSEPLTLTGKVISCSNMILDSQYIPFTILEVDNLPSLSNYGASSLSRLAIFTTVNRVEDGMIIPSKALKGARNNVGYVYVYENGALVKTNVKYGYRGNEYTWILEGLEVGQKVSIQ